MTAQSSDVGSLTCLDCGLATGSGLAKVHQAYRELVEGVETSVSWGKVDIRKRVDTNLATDIRQKLQQVSGLEDQ